MFRPKTAAIIMRYCNNINGKLRKMSPLYKSTSLKKIQRDDITIIISTVITIIISIQSLSLRLADASIGLRQDTSRQQYALHGSSMLFELFHYYFLKFFPAFCLLRGGLLVSTDLNKRSKRFTPALYE
jgi:hypothetical protein